MQTLSTLQQTGLTIAGFTYLMLWIGNMILVGERFSSNEKVPWYNWLILVSPIAIGLLLFIFGK